MQVQELAAPAHNVKQTTTPQLAQAQYFLQVLEFELAKKVYLQVLAADVSNVEAHRGLAAVYLDQGLCEKRVYHLQRVLHHCNDDCAALLALGDCKYHLGDREAAWQHFNHVWELAPDLWQAHLALAQWYDLNGSTSLLNKHLGLALHLAPNRAMVHARVAAYRFNRKRYLEAAGNLEEALQEDVDNEALQLDLAACYFYLQRAEQAQLMLSRLSSSDDEITLQRLAKLLWYCGYYGQRLAVLERLAGMRPDQPHITKNLVAAFCQQHRYQDALAVLESGPLVSSSTVDLERWYARILTLSGRTSDALAVYRGQIRNIGFMSRATSDYLRTSLAASQTSRQTLARYHRKMVKPWVEMLQQDLPYEPDLAAGKVLQVGFVYHAVDTDEISEFFSQAFFSAARQVSDLKLTIYFHGQKRSKAIQWLSEKGYQVVLCQHYSDDQLYDHITSAKIDILVDMYGHGGHNRLQVFARRAAPIQLAWLGYPHSTGLKTMDYLIADSVLCPESNDRLFSETILRLPEHSLFCREYATADIIQAAPLVPASHLTIGCFSDLSQSCEKAKTIWLRVLLENPRVHLCLQMPMLADSKKRDELKAYFSNRGVDSDRLWLSGGDQKVRQIMLEKTHLVIDILPVNNPQVTYSALASDIPVVALLGERMSARMSASVLNWAGLSEWVANDVENLVATVTELCQNNKKMNRLRHHIQLQLSRSNLGDAPGYARSVEHLLRRAWADHCMPCKRLNTLASI